MKKRFARVLLLVGALTALAKGVYAQDPQYSQFYSNLVMLNPAFTGSGIGYRVAANYRGQWVNIPGYYKQMALSADMPLFIGSTTQGVGLSIIRDVAGEGDLAKTSVLLNYAYELPLTDVRDGGHTLRFGLSGGIQQTSLDFFKLRFPDQIEPRDGFVNATQEPFGNAKNSRILEDVNAGVVYYNNYAFVGLTVDHISEPRQRFYDFNLSQGINPKLPRKYTLTGGMRIPLGDFRDPDKFSITPAFLVKMQRQFFQFDLGAYVNVDPMVFGVWYRHQDAVIGLIGVKKGAFSFGYSYDYTISPLTNGVSGGSHELSLIMEWEKYRKNKFKHRDLPCPRF